MIKMPNIEVPKNSYFIYELDKHTITGVQFVKYSTLEEVPTGVLHRMFALLFCDWKLYDNGMKIWFGDNGHRSHDPEFDLETILQTLAGKGFCPLLNHVAHYRGTSVTGWHAAVQVPEEKTTYAGPSEWYADNGDGVVYCHAVHDNPSIALILAALRSNLISK